MKKLFKFLGSILITLVAIAIAVLIILHLWHYYQDDPWTRDAHIQADVVQVAPDVSGLVTAVSIQDNAPVTKGQVLFVVDQSRYTLAVRQAKASIEQLQARLNQLQRESNRNRDLKGLVSSEVTEEGKAKVSVARSELDAAGVSLDLAQLNLDRTVVRSPATGFVNDRTVRLGDYVSTGHPVLSIVDTATLHIDGYFEETKLARIHVGQPVRIRLMGIDHLLNGRVQSVAAGIEDRNRGASSNLLPNIDPTFNWVRLAQRIPVRISIDNPPSSVRLVVGRTATVTIEPETSRHNTAQADRSTP